MIVKRMVKADDTTRRRRERGGKKQKRRESSSYAGSIFTERIEERKIRFSFAFVTEEK